MSEDIEKQKSLGLLGYLYREAYHCNGCVSIKYSCEFCDKKNEIECNDAHSILSNLIEDYYKLKENHIALSKAFDELYDLIYRPKPYKFEDLKVGMWVYDINPDFEEVTFFKIEKILTEEECKYLYNNKYEKVFIDNMLGFVREFEENRFFPVTKAMVVNNE